MTRACQRPENHDCEEASPRPEEIHQAATTGIHETIRDEKRRLEQRELLVRNRNIVLDGLDRDWESLAVQITNRDRDTDKKGNAPAQFHKAHKFRSPASNCKDFRRRRSVTKGY